MERVKLANVVLRPIQKLTDVNLTYFVYTASLIC